MLRIAQQERQAICETFLRVGPLAPTLDPPWLSKDLAAHLVVRDRRPDASLSQVVKRLASRSQQIQDSYAARPWEELVDLVRSGPPAWSLARLGPVDEVFNGSEFFIHHEDVLRAAPGWTARPLSREVQAVLWNGLQRVGGLALRRAPVGVVAEAPGFGETLLRKPTERGTVRLTGSPSELTLYVSGRQRVAEVVLDGPADAAEAFARMRFGFG